MKSVLIQGTNCVGKSTLMRNLIRFFGGVKRTEGKLLTFCEYNGKKIAIVGTYGERNCSCGYDACYKYKKLPELAKMAKELGADYVFAEGLMLKTFGPTPLLYLFEHSDGQFVFRLCCDRNKIVERLFRRTGRSNIKYNNVWSKDTCSLRSYEKFIEIGCEGSIIRTDILNEQQVMSHVLKKVGLADG